MRPAGNCVLCSSRTQSLIPTSDKGATKCLLDPSPTLVQFRSLSHRDSHRDEQMCLSDGATRPPDHSRVCFLSQSLDSSLPCNCACSSPTWARPHPSSSCSTFTRYFLCAQPRAGCWGYKQDKVLASWNSQSDGEGGRYLKK